MENRSACTPHDPPKPFFYKGFMVLLKMYYVSAKISIAKMVLRAIFKMATNENGINLILIFNYHREVNLVSKLIFSRSINTMGTVFGQ